MTGKTAAALLTEILQQIPDNTIGLILPSQVRTVLNDLTNSLGATLLNVLTASNSTNLQDTTSITSSFDEYLIALENIVPVTNAVGLQLQVQVSAAFQNTNYLNAAGGATTYIDLLAGATTLSNTATAGFSGTLHLHGVNSAFFKMLEGTAGFYTGASAISAVSVTGAYNANAANAVTGILVQASSGNISTGRIKIYGLP